MRTSLFKQYIRSDFIQEPSSESFTAYTSSASQLDPLFGGSIDGLTGVSSYIDAILQRCRTDSTAERRAALKQLSHALSNSNSKFLRSTVAATWDVLQECLQWGRGIHDPSYVVAVLHLARSIAGMSFTGGCQHISAQNTSQIQDTLSHEIQAQNVDSRQKTGAGIITLQGDHIASISAAHAVGAIICTSQHQEQRQQTEGTAQPAAPVLRRQHAVAVHSCLCSWAGHWHPHVRRAALQGLLAAHSGSYTLEEYTAGIQAVVGLDISAPRLTTPVYQCSSVDLVEQAYSCAVVALADDDESVRSVGAAVIAAVAAGAPGLILPGDRWTQLGHSQALVDDAFQRLCACLHDDEPRVRETALRLLSGIPSPSPRVKLQVLSKKATVAVSLPKPAGMNIDNVPAQQQKKGGKGNHTRSKGTAGNKTGPQGGHAGGGGVDTSSDGGASWSWCGGPGARGLPLLEASIGGLVHGTEDEDWSVRCATASVLCSMSQSELVVLQARGLEQQQGVQQSAPGLAPAQADDSADRRQIASQCLQYLCDFLQDDCESVRLASLIVLKQLMVVGSGQAQVAAAPTDLPSSLAQQQSSLAGIAIQGTKKSGGRLECMTKEHLSEMLNTLSDPAHAVRDAAFAALGSLGTWSSSFLELATHHIIGLLPHVIVKVDAARLLELVRTAASSTPASAKSVATSIAKAMQQQQQQLGVAEGGHRGKSKDDPGAWGQINRQHLLVMQALSLGAGIT